MTKVAKKKTGESRAGKHASPRRQLLASPEQFEAWDAAAKTERLTWAEWARQALDYVVFNRIRVRQ